VEVMHWFLFVILVANPSGPVWRALGSAWRRDVRSHGRVGRHSHSSRMKWAHPTVWFMTNLRASDAASADLADAGIQNCFTSLTVRSRCHIELGAPCPTALRLAPATGQRGA